MQHTLPHEREGERERKHKKYDRVCQDRTEKCSIPCRTREKHIVILQNLRNFTNQREQRERERERERAAQTYRVCKDRAERERERDSTNTRCRVVCVRTEHRNAGTGISVGETRDAARRRETAAGFGISVEQFAVHQFKSTT